MRKGKNPSVKQMELLQKKGLDAHAWLLVKTETHQLTFRHKETNELITIETH